MSAASEPTSKPVQPLPLRDLASRRGLLIGAAVAPKPLRDDPQYGATLAREFNLLPTENALKFRNTHPERDKYTFDNADYIVNFAQQHKLKVRGHTLVWHYPSTLPPWLTDPKNSPADVKQILHDHISTVAGRYKGKIYAWDVVNEAVDDDGTLRESFWKQCLGPDYLELAFRWAHEADPKAKLFYNDYEIEGINKKSDMVYKLLKDLRSRGVPIHGVGLQCHLFDVPDKADMIANIKRFTDLGLEVHITELDVPIQDMTGAPEEKLARQAQIYRQIMEVCLANKGCKAFVTWGLDDRHSWIPGFTGKPDVALLFDENYQPKPAYHAIAEVMAIQPQIGK